MAGADGFFRYRRGRTAALLGAGALAAGFALTIRPAAMAQPVPMIGTASIDSIDVDATAPDPDATPGFMLTKEDSKTLDKLEDFRLAVDKKSWARAFGIFNTLANTQGTGMVQTKGGFLFPLRRQLSMYLAALPPEGRDAYRLFYDAEARQLWDRLSASQSAAAQNTAASPAAMNENQELQALQKIVNRYSLTSVGDLAADRLGDLLFERGDFGGAEGAWRSVVQDYPDTRLQIAKLQVKRCVAYARLGRTEQLGALAALVREKYADEKVTIAGKTVAAADFVKSLLSPATPDLPPAAAIPPVDAIRIHDGILWQIQPLPDHVFARMDAIQHNGMSMYFDGAVPPAAVDDKRVYVNLMGVVYAADLDTGLLAWRSGVKFSELPQKAISSFENGVDPTRYSLLVSAGRVYTQMQDQQQNGNAAGAILHCLNAQDGKEIWKGDTLGMTSMSLPTIVGNTGYCIGVLQDTTYLMALNLAEKGKQEWRLPLGKPQGAMNYRGMMQVQEPSIVATAGMLYVSTNNGALLAVNTSQRRIEWAFRCGTKPQNSEGGRVWNGYGYVRSVDTPGTLLLQNNTLYLKDSGDDALYAIDPSGPALKWSPPRALAADYSIFACSGPMAYLMQPGSDPARSYIEGLDLANRHMSWSQDMKLTSGNVKPLLTRKHIYVFAKDGIHDINLDDPARECTRFRSSDPAAVESVGGELFLAGDKLVSVSDQTVTAYRVDLIGASAAENDTRRLPVARAPGGN